jgi:hypothetical protein
MINTSLALTPSELQTVTADGRARLAAVRERQERLADELAETRWPIVPYNDPAWFVEARDFETWELGSAIPFDAALLPPYADDLAAYAAGWPNGGDS